MNILARRSSCCIPVLVLLLFTTERAPAQSTPQPTSASGTNRITRSSDGRTYTFSYNGIALYRYTLMPDGSFRGNFNGLSASANGRDYFSPSMCGGVLAVDGERIVYPCEGGVSFGLQSQFFTRDSVALLWRMYQNNRQLYGYRMSFRIKGKTLVIDIECEGDDRNGAGITLGEGISPRNSLAVVPVPYLPMTSLLHERTSKSFASMFFDWERTNCSRMLPLSAQAGHTLYASSADYFPRTDGVRNRIKERIYLTVSNEINEVLPNVVGPVAPLRNKLQDKIIISYHPPFPWLLDPIIPNTSLPSYLDTLKNLGITDVALLVKDWWWSGFDRGNPKVLPANNFDRPEGPNGTGGNGILLRVRDKARSLGYMLGLHQNYVDMYSETREGGMPDIAVDASLIAKLPGTEERDAWAYVSESRNENAWAIKPAQAFSVAGQVSAAIYNEFKSDWNYLDVTSALNPSGPLPLVRHGSVNSYVDFDASQANPGRDSSGMFLYTLRNYRTVPEAVRRNTNNGPTQGEGGYHFLYAGYFDNFEARIKTAIPGIAGYTAPLLVNFHFNKLHGKSSYHGAGHIYEFYDRGWGAFFNEKEVLTFMATEIAYGHGALISKSAHNCMDDSPCDHSLKHIALENKHVLPLQKLLMRANPARVTYYDRSGAAKTASRYIADNPTGFADITSPNFMGRIRVEYSNGVVVYVNRNREAGSWTIRGLPSGRRYNYNILRNGRMVQGVGAKPTEPLVLSAECGWVWYAQP